MAKRKSTTPVQTARPPGKRGFGWKKDRPDPRDHLFLPPPVIAANLPPMVDHEPNCVPVRDQSQLGCCTGFGIRGAVGFDLATQHCPMPFDPSPLYIYWLERSYEGTVDEDAGAEIRDGVKQIAKYGVTDEKLWPYDINRYQDKPSQEAFAFAKQHRAIRYQRVLQDERHIKSALASGFPVIFGFNVYESFESDMVAQSGVLDLPGPGEQLLGGHCVLMVGYEDASRRVKVMNSWGTEWGMNGYFTMPYEYVTRTDLASDFWIVQRVQF